MLNLTDETLNQMALTIQVPIISALRQTFFFGGVTASMPSAMTASNNEFKS
jgi:hypothetical protein